MILQKIENIISLQDFDNFEDCNLENLTFGEYKNVVAENISKIFTASISLTQINILVKFFKLVVEKKFFNNQIEEFHYKILIDFLNRSQYVDEKNVFYHTQISLILVDCLSNTLSKEKLNFYNQENNTSILKYLLKFYLNVPLLNLLHSKGLDFLDVEGLNPYYYVLKNSNSTSFIVESLFNLKVPLPKNYWAYIFKEISYGRLDKNKNFLLQLPDKKFIVDSETEECVWNLIIKNKSYDLIKFIPEEFYKPYTLNGKTLFEEILKVNDFSLIEHLKWDIIKLLDNEKDIVKLFLSLLKDESNIEKFYLKFLKQIMTNYSKLERKENEVVVSAYKSWNNANNFSKLNNITLVAITIVSELKKNKEIEGDIFNLSKSYYDLDTLIKVYKTRRDFSNETRSIILNYLESLNNFNLSAPKQDENTYEEHSETLKKINFINDYEIVKTSISDEILLEILNFLEESKFVLLFKSITNHINSFNFPEMNNVILYEKKEEDNTNEGEENIVELKKIYQVQTENENLSTINIELFTKDSFEKFKKEFGTSNNEVLKDFINKHKNYEQFQNKTLASASNFLENIEKLYETFPHFEEVIKHIENIMILQNKGDKSFYIPPLLLGGGPGVGKTFFCNTISKLVNTHFELLNMESMTANFILTGLNSQWRDATPGKIFRSLFDKDNKNMNPIFLLDELEKAGGDSRYSVMNSLLPLLERYTAKNFKDECIPLNINASYVVWIATANDIDKLTAPIKSRFDIFSVPNPTPNQRKSLIKGIYQAVRNNNSWGNYFSETLPEETLDVLANLMSPGAARDLRKSITMACSKAVKEEKNIILPSHIERYEQGEIMPWDVVT